MENVSTFENVPREFARCFNHSCPQAAACLRRRVALAAPANQREGMAVYPAAWRDGACTSFRTAEPVAMAWGFGGLYRHLEGSVAAQARRDVQHYFSTGAGPYYRYHHGERLLTPRQQRDILALMAHYGPADDLRFDHYVRAFDFSNARS